MAAFHIPPPPLPDKPKGGDRNPKPVAVDMEAMLLAAKQHMQQSLSNKLRSIGVPVKPFGGGGGGGAEPPDDIPLPAAPAPMTAPPPMAAMPSAVKPSAGLPPPMPMPPHMMPPVMPMHHMHYQPIPVPDVPVPGYEMGGAGIPAQQPAEDIAPPGEGPDPEELRMLGIDPADLA